MSPRRLCLVAALAASPWAGAASQFEFNVWMRVIDQRSVSVQRHIAAHNTERARADAIELERHYALMETYFGKDHPAADAARQSAEGRELAAAMQSALDKHDYTAASQSALTLARACNDCHDNHKPFR